MKNNYEHKDQIITVESSYNDDKTLTELLKEIILSTLSIT